jgi:signal peptidase II
MRDDSRIPTIRVLCFWSLACIGCAADLISKHFVFRHPGLHRGSEWWLWEGHIGIQKSLNEGALFGMGQGQVWLFALFSILAALAIPIWLFRIRAAQDRWLTVALGCVMGGILGNLYDRMGLHGLTWDQLDPARAGQRVFAVRDFVLLQWDANLVWPNFNIADSLLVCGAGLLLVQSFLSRDSSLSCDAPQTCGLKKPSR